MLRSIKFKLTIIFILALSLRLMAIAMMSSESKHLEHDAYRYNQIAKSILIGEGFSKNGKPIAWRGPVYPYFLAIIYKIFGLNVDIVRIIQAVLASLLCLVVYKIGLLVFSETVGLGAAFFCAIYQPFIKYLYWGGPAYLYTETLFMLLIALSIWALLIYSRNQTLKNMFLAALALAVAALIKPTVLIFFPLLGLWIWHLKRFSFLKTIRDFLFILILFFIVALPWTIRNYLVFGEFIFISNEGGDVFLKGNHPLASGGVVWVKSELEKNPENFRRYSETYIKNAKYKEGLHYLFSNPKRIPYLMFKKIIVNWNVFGEDGLYNFYYGLALFFGIIGIAFSLREIDTNSLLLLSMLFWVSLIALIFFGEPRYRYPAEPYLIIFAVYGIYCLFSRTKNRILSSIISACIILLNLLGYIFSKPILGFFKKIIV
jgi:4-amino-4-deoxy-L-arabinose transferase-like glycosyltransferase